MWELWCPLLILFAQSTDGSCFSSPRSDVTWLPGKSSFQSTPVACKKLPTNLAAVGELPTDNAPTPVYLAILFRIYVAYLCFAVESATPPFSSELVRWRASDAMRCGGPWHATRNFNRHEASARVALRRKKRGGKRRRVSGGRALSTRKALSTLLRVERFLCTAAMSWSRDITPPDVVESIRRIKHRTHLHYYTCVCKWSYTIL